MLNIPCPWCGLRSEVEFSSGGESEVIRPLDPLKKSDHEWSDYLFNRTNKKGWHVERWYHIHGCRKWFHIERNTITHEIRSSWPITEKHPEGNLSVSYSDREQ
ncbi:MAG: sarcosine oxidase subunit delta [Rhodospirillaceae bacterium]|nr:sarcosine oxidase subunit delta [Rhodospirillaceae bacterium]